MQERIPFSGNPLDRASNLRRDEAWINDQLGAQQSRYLAFWRLNVLVREAEQTELHWLDASVRDHLPFDATPFLLGVQEGVAHFAVDLSDLTDPISICGIEGADFTDARRIAASLPGGDAGILAQGRALLEWHARHRYCGTCGAPTEVGGGGSMRRCTSCAAEHFPSPHPVVIMVVWNGDRCLLGRGKGWAPGRYSALAGFIDQGETIEEAVAREVKEEVGLDVDEVTYQSSQPWPFPMSLMIGCFAHVTDESFTVDPEELEEARWFSRDEILRAYESPESVDFGIPGRIAIAHHIIKAWSQ
ncbi:MAG: NAD(+) diphosphatase [Dehalococcoidia bacterium]